MQLEKERKEKSVRNSEGSISSCDIDKIESTFTKGGDEKHQQNISPPTCLSVTLNE
jgi:hypothetical protein